MGLNDHNLSPYPWGLTSDIYFTKYLVDTVELYSEIAFIFNDM